LEIRLKTGWLLLCILGQLRRRLDWWRRT